MTSDEEWVFDDGTVDIGDSEAAFVVDDERTVGYATDRFVERVGRPRSDLVGADCGDVVAGLGDGEGRLHAAIEGVLCGDLNHSRTEVSFAPAESGASAQRPLREAQVTPVLHDRERRGALVVFRGDGTVSERLAETHQRYRTLVERNRDGVTIVQDGENAFVNNRFAEMVGYSKSELVGESFLATIAPEDRGLVQQRYEQRMRGESPPQRYEMGLRMKGGEKLTVEVNVAAIQYDGAPAVLATFRDITERKRREHELRRFRRAIETAPHGIALTDYDGTIEYVNPAFGEMTGYAAEEALGQTPELFRADATPNSRLKEMWATIFDSEVWEGYVLNQRASGEVYHALETVAPIPGADGEPEGFVGIQTDVTERVERERLVETLDRVLRHNLRNRLNVIQAHGTLLRGRGDNGVDDHVETILRSADELLETTQKGREIVKFLSQPARSRPVDAANVVRDAVATVRESHPDADVTVDAPESAQVTAVPELDRAVEELVANAIEHSDRETPTVTVSLATGPGHVEVQVADDGPGISEMEREILSETREIDQLYHGSGFGLWLVYWIVRQSGGEITIHDRAPRGTVVTLNLERGSDGSMPALAASRPDERLPLYEVQFHDT